MKGWAELFTIFQASFKVESYWMVDVVKAYMEGTRVANYKAMYDRYWLTLTWRG